MERPFRAPGGQVTGVIAVVLGVGLGVLFLPGLPAALVWPYEWVVIVLWWLVGVVFLVRVPRVGPGADAEHRVLTELRAR